MIDFTLKKKEVPEGYLYSINDILSWTHEQTSKKRKCLYCEEHGSFGIVPSDGHMQYYFLCGDHYSSEKIEKKI
jgi:hypothetical protein|tara:strand:- start:2333 stop:2554 length:222 start_codon:yes stop_codon:yes gene_type:complete